MAAISLESNIMNKYKNLIPAFSGIVFLLTAVFAVAHAWLSGIHKYDMSLSFSSYVGLSRLTSIVWFIAAVIIIPAMIFYLSGSDIRAVRKAVYGVVFLCIAGTALFPFNCFSGSPTALTCNIHNYFAIGLMLATTVSFVLAAIMPKSKKQRITAVCSIIYAAVFIVLYFTVFTPLFSTFFIWENLFIILLLINLHMEQFSEISK